MSQVNDNEIDTPTRAIIDEIKTERMMERATESIDSKLANINEPKLINATINHESDYYFNKPFKVIIVGDSLVGKTSLLKTYLEGDYKEHPSTIGIEFVSKVAQYVDDRGKVYELKIHFWDTAGQERFKCITRSYYRNSNAILLVFDLSSKLSFDHIPVWIEEIKSMISLENTLIVLVGTKADLIDSRVIEAEDIEVLINSQLEDGVTINTYVETSAIEFKNVDYLFNHLIDQLSKLDANKINYISVDELTPSSGNTYCCSYI